MLMDAAYYFGMAIVCMLVTAGHPWHTFRISALGGMLQVVFASTACFYGCSACHTIDKSHLREKENTIAP